MGVVNEDDINNMSILFFRDVLGALNRKLRYESVSNLYGNSFCKDAQKYVEELFPLIKMKKISSGFAEMLNKATVVKVDQLKTSKSALKDFGDVSWASGLFEDKTDADNVAAETANE